MKFIKTFEDFINESSVNKSYDSINEMSMSTTDIDKFVTKVTRDGTVVNSVSRGSDPTALSKVRCTYKINGANNLFYSVELFDNSYGVEIKIWQYQELNIKDSVVTWIYLENSGPKSKWQITKRRNGLKTTTSLDDNKAIYEIMKNSSVINEDKAWDEFFDNLPK